MDAQQLFLLRASQSQEPESQEPAACGRTFEGDNPGHGFGEGEDLDPEEILRLQQHFAEVFREDQSSLQAPAPSGSEEGAAGGIAPDEIVADPQEPQQHHADSEDEDGVPRWWPRLRLPAGYYPSDCPEASMLEFIEGTPPNSVRFRRFDDEEYYRADRHKPNINVLQGTRRRHCPGIAAPHDPASAAAAATVPESEDGGTYYWHPAVRPLELKFADRDTRDTFMTTVVQGTPPNTLRFCRYDGESFRRGDRLDAVAPGNNAAAASSSSAAACDPNEPSIEELEHHLRQARAAARESHGYSDSELEDSGSDFQ